MMKVSVSYMLGKYSKNKEVHHLTVSVSGRYSYKELRDAIRDKKIITGKIYIVNEEKLGFHA